MTEECFPVGTQYKIVPLKNGALAVEVSIPGKGPYPVTSFDTEGEAENWILRRQRETAEANPGR